MSNAHAMNSPYRGELRLSETISSSEVPFCENILNPLNTDMTLLEIAADVQKNLQVVMEILLEIKSHLILPEGRQATAIKDDKSQKSVMQYMLDARRESGYIHDFAKMILFAIKGEGK